MSDTQPTTMRTYFAANAPTEIPVWFNPPTKDDSSQGHEEQRYFAWRWYYADRMIEADAQDSWSGAL